MRLDDASGQEKASILSVVLAQHAESLIGSFAVLQRDRLRVRPLRESGSGRQWGAVKGCSEDRRLPLQIPPGGSGFG